MVDGPEGRLGELVGRIIINATSAHRGYADVANDLVLLGNEALDGLEVDLTACDETFQ